MIFLVEVEEFAAIFVPCSAIFLSFIILNLTEKSLMTDQISYVMGKYLLKDNIEDARTSPKGRTWRLQVCLRMYDFLYVWYLCPHCDFDPTDIYP